MKNRTLLLIVPVLAVSCAAPKAVFQIESADLKAPAEVHFVNQSENADSIRWHFGDGNESEDQSPIHSYLRSGRYEVRLEAIKGKKVSEQTKELIVETPDHCLVQVKTNYGDMLIHLYDATPKHRDNFLRLVDEGFYEDLLFHRVIDGFMIQGGDPQSKDAAPGTQLGTGGPGYQVEAEFVDSLVHVRGALAAARMGDAVNPGKKSSGSQFYIVHGEPVDPAVLHNFEIRRGSPYSEEQKKIYSEDGGTPFLDGEYTVFGRVVKGLDVIEKIAKVQIDRSDRPVEDVWMKMTVIK